MTFMFGIIGYLNDASDFFYDIYREVLDWIWPFWEAADLFYEISLIFNKLAWSFSDFTEWVYDATDKLEDVLSWGNIRNLIRDWLPDLEDITDWFYEWERKVLGVIDDWWDSISETVGITFAEIKEWTTTQLNTLRDSLLTTLADLETWTVSQIKAAKTAILATISDFEAWTSTEFNIVREWILTLIGDVESWTLSQINGVKSTFLTIVGDLETWTTTEINNISDILSTLLPWGEILDKIISWGALTGSQIDSLMDSTLKRWFPFYDALSYFWEDIKEFFTDPLQWTYNKLDEWFERFW